MGQSTEQIERFTAFVATKGLKWTRQRAAICEQFFSQHRQHVDVETLLAEVRDQEPGVGHATVYRTLKLLKEAGLVCEREFGDGRRRYEPEEAAHHHDHLICTGCGAIEEFQHATIERLQEEVARQHGFQIETHKMELYGRCRRCAERGGAAARSAVGGAVRPEGARRARRAR